MTSVDLSIIVISYNTKKITLNCLRSIINSLKRTPYKFELIIVDNNSIDGSSEAIERFLKTKKYLNFKLIKNKKNLGFGAANNQAVQKAQGKYLLFLNSDIVVLNQAIEKLLKFYITNQKKIHFLGGKLLNKNKTPQPSSGPMYSLPMIFAHLFLRGDYWGLTRSSPNKTKKVDWISGACILTTKKNFLSLGGFDEKIFMYMDEIDLFYRAKLKKMSVYFYPKARFIHLGSASSGNRTYPILQVYQGLLYLYKKHFSPTHQLILKIMLKSKAWIAATLGRIFHNYYLVTTYEKALKLVDNFR